MPAIKLNDPQWQSAIDDVAPKLDQYRQRMNNISSDLRTLEKFLTDSTFRVATRVSLPDAHDEEIGWIASADDTWRIFYTWPADDLGDGRYWKPLIEAPVSVRWRAAAAIPDLLKAIGEAATPSSPSPFEGIELTDDDIPF